MLTTGQCGRKGPTELRGKSISCQVESHDDNCREEQLRSFFMEGSVFGSTGIAVMYDGSIIAIALIKFHRARL